MTNCDPYDSLVPVFLQTATPQRVKQIGTAVFRELRGQPFLFTAAHVTDDLKNGNLLVPTALGLIPIEDYVAFIDLPPEFNRKDDDVDVAYYRLSTDFANKLAHHFRPLPPARSEIIRSAQELAVCSVVGYPASKGKKDREGVASSEIFSFQGVVADLETYSHLGLSPNHAIVIRFHKKRAVHLGTMDAFPTPSLKGISGGRIFAWPHGSELSEDWSLPLLVGIVHTYRETEGLIIGTTLASYLSAITLGEMKKFDRVE